VQPFAALLSPRIRAAIEGGGSLPPPPGILSRSPAFRAITAPRHCPCGRRVETAGTTASQAEGAHAHLWPRALPWRASIGRHEILNGGEQFLPIALVGEIPQPAKPER